MIKRLLVLCGLVLCLSQPAAAAEPLFESARTLAALQGARTLDEGERFQVEHIYPLGSVRRISGRLRYAKEVLVHGDLSKVTLQLAATQTAADAFAQVRAHWQAEHAQLLYWCEGRDCGPSNLWANAVFDYARLYGPDDQQAYSIYRTADQLLALYAITRGNGRSMVHIEQFVAQDLADDLRPSSATLLRQLSADERLTLAYLPAEPEAAWLQILTGMLKRDSTLRVAMGGAHAPVWYEALLETGVKRGRLELNTDGSEALYMQRLR